ncbi:acyl carrier protein [Streptosporangiaceae bacterium NEAU-GS5]|nr:acyl carrier protein [Streptosporangiaceae bacterium NEAU-GS5]
MTNTIYSRLTTILVANFGVPEHEITPASTFADLELDSIALVELVLVVEQEFGITVPEGELSGSDDLTKAAKLIAKVNGTS